MSGPLSGVRVLELATFVAAPVTARILADMGAEVIKVEAPTGDGWRYSGISHGAPRFTKDENPIFDIYNTGKKLVSLNLKTPKGMEAFMKLLSESDVFVTSAREGALKRLGLAYDDLKEKFPGLIYAMLLGYGKKGPEADRPAYDVTAFWSRGGFLRDMACNEENFYMPVNAPSSVGDTATGYLLVSEICAALFRRSKDGKGEFVSSTLYHNGVFCMGTMVIKSQEPFGHKYPYSRVQHGAASGNFECADGEWIYMSVGRHPQAFEKLLEKLGCPDLHDDPRFKDVTSRLQHRQEYYDYFRRGFLSRSSSEWMELAYEYDMPMTKIVHFRDVAKDEQAWANGYLEHVEFRTGNVDVMPASPIEMESAHPAPTKPAPWIGGDTTEVLQSIGYTDGEIAEMLASGAAVENKS